MLSGYICSVGCQEPLSLVASLSGPVLSFTSVSLKVTNSPRIFLPFSRLLYSSLNRVVKVTIFLRLWHIRFHWSFQDCVKSVLSTCILDTISSLLILSTQLILSIVIRYHIIKVKCPLTQCPNTIAKSLVSPTDQKPPTRIYNGYRKSDSKNRTNVIF